MKGTLPGKGRKARKLKGEKIFGRRHFTGHEIRRDKYESKKKDTAKCYTVVLHTR